ncbi:hypothetical protein Tco_0966924 [Tanacetum coccineum]
MPSQPGSSVWQRQMPAHSATQYWQRDTSPQPGSYYLFGRVPSHMGRQNLQTTIDGIFDQNVLNREKREQFPSKYKLTPFMEQPATTILPKQRVNKTKNKGKKANLSPLNLGGAFEDDNVEENNVTFFGSQFTGNFLMYENVDPTKCGEEIISTFNWKEGVLANSLNFSLFPIKVFKVEANLGMSIKASELEVTTWKLTGATLGLQDLDYDD